jgi:hypothetical protein
VPGFPPVMYEAYRDMHGIHEGVFGPMFPINNHVPGYATAHRLRIPFHENPSDPFIVIPPEIRNHVLNLLGSKDIAAMRLVSRAFRQLHRALFKRLIGDDMPWYWEIDDVEKRDVEYWKCHFEEEFGNTEGDELEARFGRINEGYKNFIKARLRGEKQNVNWLTVYERLMVLKKGLLGVRNRVRIWGLAEEIVGRIGRLRAGEDEGRFDSKFEGGIGVEPTDEERESLLGSRICPRCTIPQIHRMVELGRP